MPLVTRFENLSESDFAVRKAPRPTGYASQTMLYIGGLCVPALLYALANYLSFVLAGDLRSASQRACVALVR